MQVLIECGELRLDFGQRRLQCCATGWVGGALRKNVFALEVEGLAAAFGCGAVFDDKTPFCFAH